MRLQEPAARPRRAARAPPLLAAGRRRPLLPPAGPCDAAWQPAAGSGGEIQSAAASTFLLCVNLSLVHNHTQRVGHDLHRTHAKSRKPNSMTQK
eukprot:COSAG01_NODE_2099_length_8429_cov_228.935414_1_plen_94_part_00